MSLLQKIKKNKYKNMIFVVAVAFLYSCAYSMEEKDLFVKGRCNGGIVAKIPLSVVEKSAVLYHKLLCQRNEKGRQEICLRVPLSVSRLQLFLNAASNRSLEEFYQYYKDLKTNKKKALVTVAGILRSGMITAWLCDSYFGDEIGNLIFSKVLQSVVVMQPLLSLRHNLKYNSIDYVDKLYFEKNRWSLRNVKTVLNGAVALPKKFSDSRNCVERCHDSSSKKVLSLFNNGCLTIGRRAES